MCTPNIGQALINLYKKLGYTVISDSHIGDWGGIFGKLIYAWKYDNSIFFDTEYLTQYSYLSKEISLSNSRDEVLNKLL
jgi:arginyl-tRNA synthetase